MNKDIISLELVLDTEDIYGKKKGLDWCFFERFMKNPVQKDFNIWILEFLPVGDNNSSL